MFSICSQFELKIKFVKYPQFASILMLSASKLMILWLSVEAGGKGTTSC